MLFFLPWAKHVGIPPRESICCTVFVKINWPATLFLSPRRSFVGNFSFFFVAEGKAPVPELLLLSLESSIVMPFFFGAGGEGPVPELLLWPEISHGLVLPLASLMASLDIHIYIYTRYAYVAYGDRKFDRVGCLKCCVLECNMHFMFFSAFSSMHFQLFSILQRAFHAFQHFASCIFNFSAFCSI